MANYVKASCGHPVVAAGAPGSYVRNLAENSPCQVCKRNKPLFDWLEANNAKKLGSAKADNGSEIDIYLINACIVHVTWYANRSSWDIMLSASASCEIDKTLRDADEHIRMLSNSPTFPASGSSGK